MLHPFLQQVLQTSANNISLQNILLIQILKGHYTPYSSILFIGKPCSYLTVYTNFDLNIYIDVKCSCMYDGLKLRGYLYV